MRRRMLASVGGKPLPYLRRVAYLDSHGREWIDTGIVPTSDYGFEVKLIKFDNSETAPLGTWNNWLIEMFGGDFKYGVNGGFLATFGSNYTDTKLVYLNVEMIEKLLNKRLTLSVDGSIKFDRTFTDTFECHGTVYLFSNNVIALGGFRHAGRCRIFYAQITDGSDSLVRDFIPVLDLSGRPAMYDEVSGQFFYNQGTGEFTWGELET